MTDFVLVHGGFHGGWCWYKIVAALQRAGHRAVAPDLPGHGRDKLPIAQVTLQAYVDRVCEVIDAQAGAVVLVGHSMGGGVVTQVAELRAERIRKLVYVSAFVVPDGKTLLEVMSQDGDSLALQNLVAAPDQSHFTLREGKARETFFGDCSDEDVALAESLLVPQAIAPVTVPVRTSAQRYGRVPRAFIQCRQDHAITPAAQARLAADFEPADVYALDTHHSPFFSAPQELAAILARF